MIAGDPAQTLIDHLPSTSVEFHRYARPLAVKLILCILQNVTLKNL
jgi:hypothetical protein